MIENKPLLIHIGYHKTATSWLQNELFISTNDIFEPLSKTNTGDATLSWKFVRDEDGYLLSSFETNMEVIRKELLKIRIEKKDIRDKVFVMSSERLSGTPRSGGFDAKLIAQRLALAFPAAKILIVIREQKSFFLSSYLQHLSKGAIFSYQQYFNVKYHNIPLFSPKHVLYNHLVEEYYSLFGKENVLVLPYEMFKLSPETYINSIGNLIGKTIRIDRSRLDIYHNRKESLFVMYYFRWLNLFLDKRSLIYHSGFYNKYTRFLALKLQSILRKMTPDPCNAIIRLKVKNYIDDWVGDRYCQSNEKLSELIDIDLSEYGYH